MTQSLKSRKFLVLAILMLATGIFFLRFYPLPPTGKVIALCALENGDAAALQYQNDLGWSKLFLVRYNSHREMIWKSPLPWKIHPDFEQSALQVVESGEMLIASPPLSPQQTKTQPVIAINEKNSSRLWTWEPEIPENASPDAENQIYQELYDAGELILVLQTYQLDSEGAPDGKSWETRISSVNKENGNLAWTQFYSFTTQTSLPQTPEPAESDTELEVHYLTPEESESLSREHSIPEFDPEAWNEQIKPRDDLKIEEVIEFVDFGRYSIYDPKDQFQPLVLPDYQLEYRYFEDGNPLLASRTWPEGNFGILATHTGDLIRFDLQDGKEIERKRFAGREVWMFDYGAFWTDENLDQSIALRGIYPDGTPLSPESWFPDSKINELGHPPKSAVPLGRFEEEEIWLVYGWTIAKYPSIYSFIYRVNRNSTPVLSFQLSNEPTFESNHFDIFYPTNFDHWPVTQAKFGKVKKDKPIVPLLLTADAYFSEGGFTAIIYALNLTEGEGEGKTVGKIDHYKTQIIPWEDHFVFVSEGEFMFTFNREDGVQNPAINSYFQGETLFEGHESGPASLWRLDSNGVIHSFAGKNLLGAPEEASNYYFVDGIMRDELETPYRKSR